MTAGMITAVTLLLYYIQLIAASNNNATVSGTNSTVSFKPSGLTKHKRPDHEPVLVPAQTGRLGCPSEYLPAVGTLYDSWPKPGTRECLEFSGCKYAGQFSRLDPQDRDGKCKRGARVLDGGNGAQSCRWPESLVKQWRLAATWERDALLLGRQLELIIQGRPGKKAIVNVGDVCSDADCGGCCSRNTGRGRFKLIDLEKWAALQLLSFNSNATKFDINNVKYPASKGMRPGVPESDVIPLCYRVIGKSIIKV